MSSAKVRSAGSQRRFGLAGAFINAAALFDARLDFVLQRRVFVVEALQGNVGVHRLALFALDVGCELLQAAIEFGHALLGAGFLAVEQVARIGQALQTGGGGGFGLAQRGQSCGAHGLFARGLGLLAGALGEFAHGEVMVASGFGDIAMCAGPAQMEQHRFGLAHLGGDFAIADRLARLALQSVHLRTRAGR